MSRIIKIGMDVHTKSYTLCAIEPFFSNNEMQTNVLVETKVPAEPQKIIDFVKEIRRLCGDDCDILCGYEAGCLGYSLYRSLKESGIACVILAPSTMMEPKSGVVIKTDARDARSIALCMAFRGSSYIHIPTIRDEEIKGYIRMRDDHKLILKKTKQQILAFCLTKGLRYERSNWTQIHLKWLRNLILSPMEREILNEYLITYSTYEDRIERFDQRIEELASEQEYAESVKKLIAFCGIKTHTAMAFLCEVGDFQRFPRADSFARYLGLIPGENSSGEKCIRTGITKAGNSHLRRLLIEAAHGIASSKSGYKSKAQKARQAGNPSDIIAYADRANERLKRRYQRMIFHGKNHNVAITAIARELACFIWGMMTDHFDKDTSGISQPAGCQG